MKLIKVEQMVVVLLSQQLQLFRIPLMLRQHMKEPMYPEALRSTQPVFCQ